MKILNRKQQDITTTRKIFKAKVALSLFPFLVTIFSLAINVTPTYADNKCEESLDSNSIVYINESGDISYPSGINRSAVDWHKSEAILTLHNYMGPTICSQYEEPINLVLDGNNIIYGSYVALYFNDDLIVNGDGDLIMEMPLTSGYAIGIEADKIFLDGVKISQNINTPYQTSDCSAISSNRGIFIKDSEISSPCGIYDEKESVILNNSDVSVAYIYGEAVFNQIGGTLNIVGNSPEDTACLQATKAIFDSATASIDCTGLKDNFAIALTMSDQGLSQEDFSEYIEENFVEDFKEEDFSYTLREEGGIIRYRITIFGINFDILFPQNQEILFSNSDVIMKSDLASIVFAFVCETKESSCDPDDLSFATKDQLIKIGDGLITDPVTIALEHSTNQDDEEVSIVYFFTDGTPGTYFNIEDDNVSVSDNIIKTLHVYKSDSPEPPDPKPSPDPGPDIPNTLDSALFSIISTIIVSIIAEVFIIIDLRKRIYSTQDEIVNEEAKTINSYIDSISSKPEKK